MFSLEFSLYALISTGICIVAALVAAWLGAMPFLKVARQCAKSFLLPKDISLPKVSVIVYTHNDEDSIADCLQGILAQDYPDFEVIVVDDASSDTTTDIVEKLVADDSRLYMTFAPDGSHNLSRHKLALTLGFKAAKGDVVVTTSAMCRVASDSWLREMCSAFASPEISVSLGYAGISVNSWLGIGKYYREYDAMLMAVQWLSSAIAGKPYRGDGFNLAFRRELFFEQGGYSAINWMIHGEDDIFINNIANANNCVTVISPGARVLVDRSVDNGRIWLDKKERYDFTRHYLPRKPFMKRACASFMYWLSFISAIAAVVDGLPSLIPAIVALLILFILWGFSIYAYRKCASAIGATRLWWAVLPFRYVSPLVNAVYRIRFKKRKMSNYTRQHCK